MPFLLLAAVLSDPAVFAPANRPADPADRLARALGAPDFATRERASAALRAMGAPALPAVRRAVASADPEVRQRAAALLPALQMQAAIEPKRVRLPPAATLDGALLVIMNQTGYAVGADAPLGDTQFAFGAHPTTFWEAVEQVAERSGRGVVATETREGLRLLAARRRAPFVSTAGAFRVELTDLHEDRDIDFGAPHPGRELGKRDHQLTLGLSVMAEPRFRVLACGPAEVTAAVDDKGGRLAAIPSDAERNTRGVDRDERGGSDFQLPTALRLRRSARSGTEIRTLTGVLPVRLVVERKRVVIPNFRRAVGKNCSVGSDELTLEEVKVDASGLYLEFHVTADARDGLPDPIARHAT